MEYESGGREALLSFWLECDKGQGPILFPPDASQRALPPHLFRAYRRLWLSYESGTILLGQLLKKGWRKTPRLWRVILSAAYSELMWSDSSQYFAIVHSWVEIAKHKGNKVAVAVINGCLRSVCRQMESGTWSRAEVIPKNYRDAWVQSGGFLENMVNILDEQRRQFWFPEKLLDSPPVEGAEKMESGVLQGWRLPLGIFPESFINEHGGFFQNLSAAELCGEVVKDFKARGAKQMLDVCAAPGGKSWQMSRLGIQSVRYFDDNPKRLLEMEQSKIARLYPNVKKVSLKNLEELTFDSVLLDVPCSNSGVLSKCPEAIRHYWKAGDEFLEVQEQILLKGLSILKEGGRLYYSTCSIDPVENSMRVKEFARKFQLKVLAEKQWIPDGVGRHGDYLAMLDHGE